MGTTKTYMWDVWSPTVVLRHVTNVPLCHHTHTSLFQEDDVRSQNCVTKYRLSNTLEGLQLIIIMLDIIMLDVYNMRFATRPHPDPHAMRATPSLCFNEFPSSFARSHSPVFYVSCAGVTSVPSLTSACELTDRLTDRPPDRLIACLTD